MDDMEVLVEAVERAGMREPLVMVLPHVYPCAVVKVMGPGLAGYFGHGCKWGRPV